MTTPGFARNSWRGRFMRYAPLIIWAAVVLGLGFGEASMSETSRFIRPLLKFLFPDAPDATVAAFQTVIRKFAHVTEYAILAFLAVRAFSTSSIKLIKTGRFWLAVVLVAVVAGSDEFHQYFEPLRTSSIYDVLLDCIGGAAMIIVYWLVSRRRASRSSGRSCIPRG